MNANLALIFFFQKKNKEKANLLQILVEIVVIHLIMNDIMIIQIIVIVKMSPTIEIIMISFIIVISITAINTIIFTFL